MYRQLIKETKFVKAEGRLESAQHPGGRRDEGRNGRKPSKTVKHRLLFVFQM